MSLKRKVARAQLRVVKAEEAAFRETLSVVGALLDLGLSITDIQVGFMPSPAATKRALVPIVIARRGEKAFTYRLNDFGLAGTQEFIEGEWRAWLDEIRGTSADVPRARIDGFYRASRFVYEGVRNRLRTALLQAGLELPGFTAADGRI